MCVAHPDGWAVLTAVYTAAPTNAGMKMGIDSKYGRVTTEHPGPDEDEPVVVFRAQDQLLPLVLEHYGLLCQAFGSPEHHVELVDQTLGTIREWQQEHYGQVRLPNSDRWYERTGGQ